MKFIAEIGWNFMGDMDLAHRMIRAAKEAGADKIGMEELADEIKSGSMDFDVVIATPDTMKIVSPLGQILGPKGLMPNPKSETVTKDILNTVKNAKSGQIRYKSDKQAFRGFANKVKTTGCHNSNF